MVLFAWLYYGIHADKLILGQYEVDGLYIKLDKKLTLKVEKITIPETKEKPSFDNIDETFDRIKHLFTYFDYIDLQEVDFKNNKLTFLFADNVLYVTTDDYEIAGNIERKGNRLIADVSLLYIKKQKVNIVGKLKYFLNKDRLETEGAFEGFNISGNFAAMKDDDKVSFALKSNEFYDLKTITSQFPLKEIVKSWIADKIVAKTYKLDSFVGKADIVNNALKLDISSLRGEASLKDIKVDFKEGLDQVLAKGIKLSYRNGALYFNLKDPTYKDRDLNGSKVAISNMKKGHIALLHLDLHVKSEVDNVVHKILKAYKLKIPVTQKGKKVIADINLTIPLKKKFKSPEEKAKHKIKAVIDVQLAKGDVSINGIKLPVQKGSVHYDKGIVTLKNIDVKEKWYAGKVNGKIHLKNKKADLKLNMDYLNFGSEKEKFFTLKNKKNVALKIDYAAHTVNIPLLNAKLFKENKKFTIKLTDLKKIKPYLKKIDIQVDGGNLEITTKDFSNYSFAGVIKRNSCFFYDKNNVCHTRVICKGEVSKNKFILNAFDDRLKIDMSKSKINVNNLNIDLKAFFDSRMKNQTAQKGSKGKSLNIYGKKSKLRYGDYTLVTDKYKINVTPKGNIKAFGNLGKDKVVFIKKGKDITIEALRVSDRLLHPLINFNGLHHGRYSFKTHGDLQKLMYGEIIVEGGVMRDFKAYNNTLAFLNTLPALATLNKPGYSSKGFHIKKGVAKYRKIGEKIIFDMIHIEGDSANIVGKGVINLKKNTININLAIQTAREFGKAVGSIPLLGYILMGSDKSMTVGLKITGSLSKPVVKTSASKELLSLPLDLIKRTLTSPAHILNKKPKSKQEPLLKIKKPEIFNKVSP